MFPLVGIQRRKNSNNRERESTQSGQGSTQSEQRSTQSGQDMYGWFSVWRRCNKCLLISMLVCVVVVWCDYLY